MKKLIENIKLWFGKNELKNQLNQLSRKPNFKSFESSKNIGILFNANAQQDFDQLKSFALSLKREGKEFEILGYFPDKVTFDFNTPLKDLHVLNTLDLEWNFIPKHHFALNFINKPFDILIDLNFDKQFPLTYISHTSKANFKVGRFDIENQKHLDFMLETPENGNLESFLKQLEKYLFNLNSKAA